MKMITKLYGSLTAVVSERRVEPSVLGLINEVWRGPSGSQHLFSPSLPTEGKRFKITAVHIDSMTHARSWDGLRFNGDSGRNYHLKSVLKKKVQFQVRARVVVLNKAEWKLSAFVYLPQIPSDCWQLGGRVYYRVIVGSQPEGRGGLPLPQICPKGSPLLHFRLLAQRMQVNQALEKMLYKNKKIKKKNNSDLFQHLVTEHHAFFDTEHMCDLHSVLFFWQLGSFAANMGRKHVIVIEEMCLFPSLFLFLRPIMVMLIGAHSGWVTAR